VRVDVRTSQWETRIVATIVVLGFTTVCILVFYKVIDVGMKDIALLLFGYLAAKFGTVVDYYMGSSNPVSKATPAEQEKKP
jgi:hypothetical protein